MGIKVLSRITVRTSHWGKWSVSFARSFSHEDRTWGTVSSREIHSAVGPQFSGCSTRSLLSEVTELCRL